MRLLEIPRMLHRNFWFFSFVTTWLLILSTLSGLEGFAVTSKIPIKQKIQAAIRLSSMQNNITAIHIACEEWESVFHANARSERLQLETNIFSLCHALYASCLVRIGRDEDAILQYDEALKLLNNDKAKDKIVNSNIRDVIHGKAQAFQRLLQYTNAKDEFQTLVQRYPNDENVEKYMIGVVNCYLRLEEVIEARQFLEDCSQRSTKNRQEIPSAKAMLGILKYLESGIPTKTLDALEPALNISPLYMWIHHCLQPTSIKSINLPNTNQAFFELIKVNLSPLDDASLVLLDDKVNLHNLLITKKSNQDFWPVGLILPDDKVRLKQLSLEGGKTKGQIESLWISKQRAGYGSHGNKILTLEQASTECHDGLNKYLLQKMIEPSLLINGRKFSLRIYVVYFSPNDVFLSTEGLVKVASIPVSQNRTHVTDGMFMTNSGREEKMIQKDLRYLKETCFSIDGVENEKAYQQFWCEIQYSVRQVFDCLKNRQEPKTNNEWNQRRKTFYIPKILGFDYVLDHERKPWLIEINRFPGLEPRDESDRDVKYDIVRDAWFCANQRRLEENESPELDGIHPLQKILATLGSERDRPSSLERI